MEMSQSCFAGGGGGGSCLKGVYCSQEINHFPEDNFIGFTLTHLLDRY